MSLFSEKVRVVLVNPSHPGNIGGVARAMKNMGFLRLYLVSPRKFPHEEAVYRASGADDVLEHAQIVTSVDDAINGCSLVIGTSARLREMPIAMLTPRQAAQVAVQAEGAAEIAFMFGNEQFGLPNEDLEKCHYHVRIPTQENFSSLNLAAAVQIMVYELFLSSLEDQGESQIAKREHLATTEEIERLYQHTEETLKTIRFLDPKHPKRLMPRMRQMIQRAHLDHDEVNILRGIMRAIQNMVKQN